jgi:Arc/MetJ-type ribon-helix-helix transcriptional regulator
VDEARDELEGFDLAAWRREVTAARGTICQNCGASGGTAGFIIPPSCRGVVSVSNAIILCGRCWRLYDVSRAGASQKDAAGRSMMSVYLSEALHRRVLASVGAEKPFQSLSSLIRYVVSRYVMDEERFEDLPLYQDEGNDILIRTRFDPERFHTFKQLCDRRGMSMSDAVRSMLVMVTEHEFPGNGVAPERNPP